MKFDDAFTRLLGHEGRYSDDPKDPGNWTGGRVGVGELKGTKFGIAANTYGHLDIKNLTVDQAKAIYRTDFWDRVEGEKLHDGVAWQLFDFAVNSGPGTAVRYFQRALGVVDDGHFGPVSARAAREISETDQIMNLIAERLDFMTRRNNWDAAGKGWTRRMAKNLRYGAQDS